jgi:hypothetical protein
MELLGFVPIFFKELYTIHGFRNGHFVPLVFALLSGKSRRVYRNMWNSLKAACTERNFILQPKLIHVDFELTMHTVLNDVFPVVSLKCCRLHLGQAWYRKMQNLCLSQDYQDSDSEVGKWLKQSCGLHFFDPTEVEDCFVEDYMASAPQDERCIKYADYLVENYVTTDSRYPPTLWSEVPSDCKRTNNAAESFHSHFNAQFYSAHPSIFVFMDVIQKLQPDTYVKIRSSTQPAMSRKSERDRTDFAIA